MFAADIVQMYSQIKINSNYQNLQCIIWRYSPEEKLSINKLTTVTYSTASVPYLATRTLNHVIADDELRHLLTAQVIKNLYVDDILSGSNTEQQTKLIIHDVTLMLQQDGFELSKT